MRSVEVTTGENGLVPVAAIREQARKSRERVHSFLWEEMVRKHVSPRLPDEGTRAARLTRVEKRKRFTTA